MKSILDNSFRYTPSSRTDVSKTFARLRDEQRQADPGRVQTIVANANRLPANERQAGKLNKA